jgi:hypothetical protein
MSRLFRAGPNQQCCHEYLRERTGLYPTGPTSGTATRLGKRFRSARPWCAVLHGRYWAARRRWAHRLQRLEELGWFSPRRKLRRRAVETACTRRDPLDHLERPAGTAGRADYDTDHRTPRNGGQSAHERTGLRILPATRVGLLFNRRLISQVSNRRSPRQGGRTKTMR